MCVYPGYICGTFTLVYLCVYGYVVSYSSSMRNNLARSAAESTYFSFEVRRCFQFDKIASTHYQNSAFADILIGTDINGVISQRGVTSWRAGGYPCMH